MEHNLKRGSVVELMCVIVVLGILASAIVPRIISYACYEKGVKCKEMSAHFYQDMFYRNPEKCDINDLKEYCRISPHDWNGVAYALIKKHEKQEPLSAVRDTVYVTVHDTIMVTDTSKVPDAQELCIRVCLKSDNFYDFKKCLMEKCNDKLYE